MAIQSTPYVVGEAVEVTQEDKNLQQLLDEVNNYLFNFSNSWFFYAVGRGYFKKCVRSWTRIITHLEKFLQSPRTDYSLFMTVLDIEIQKFHKRSFYGKQLKALSELLAKGPSFTITSRFDISKRESL